MTEPTESEGSARQQEQHHRRRAIPCVPAHHPPLTRPALVERASDTSVNWLQFHPDAKSIETLMNAGMEAARQRHERGELRGLL